MKSKALILTLIAIGMAVVATSAGVDLNPKNWFNHDSPGAATSKVPVPAPADAIPASAPQTN
ncbi:MAG: hypothetical protein Q7R66_17415 [Undibacterium sp.]|uniref:hypothetical protein n=1 Tax=Undibacterium sp. TaxID=1914977 RepID=UPI002721DD6C|nr:hypothetical protein [Undibacterium sp.]MDO8653954.1 hypothetical protein [Undibacterium sp.]